MRQVLALFGALLYGSLYLVLGATTLLPQALRAAAGFAAGQRASLLQVCTRAAEATPLAWPPECSLGGHLPCV